MVWGDGGGVEVRGGVTPRSQAGGELSSPQTKLLLPFVRGSRESSGDMTPY